MKKHLLFKKFFIVLFLAGLSLAGWSQVTLPHQESFNYTVGQGLQTQAGWAAVNSGDDILIATGNLSYAGLEASTGNKITFAGGGIDASKALTLQLTDTVVYYSFIMNVTNLGSLNAVGGYFTGFGQNSTNFGATVWTGLDGTGYRIGIQPRTTPVGNTVWVGGTQLLNSQIFVVVSYELKVGTANDIVNIWVNPSSSSFGNLTAPAATATIANTAGTDLTGIVQIFIRQDSDTETPSTEMDEIRVGTTWAAVTPTATADVTAPSFIATPTNGDINVAINTPIVLTFDEAIRNIDDSEITDANVATLLTLKETDAAGADVPFTVTIDAAKKIITVTPTAALANSMVYYAAIAPVEDASNNATVLSSMTFSTVASTTPLIGDVAITETAPYYAGSPVTITWTSSNVTDVLIEAWIPSENKWDVLFASTASDGTETFPIPANAQYSAEYKLRISDIANPLVISESSMFTVIAVVNDLVSLRAQPANAIVKYTGIATVTYARTTRNQKYIQDATAAVLIDDPTAAPGFIAGTYNVGDGITNIVGKIVLYNGLIEFTPTVATGEPATGIEIVPEIRTLASLTSDDQCKLVKIENFAFKTPTQHDPTGIFVKSKNYDIDGFDNTLYAYRTAFAESDYIGGMVPVGAMSSVCLVGQFNTQMQITARSWSDMTLPFVLPSIVITEIMYTSPDVSAKQEWVELYNNGTASVDMEGFYILDADPLHKADPIVLPAGSVIAPGEYYTIETSDDGKPELFPFVPDFKSIKFNFGKADEVKLFHSNGQLIDSVSYNSVDPWPTSPNGGGSSLTLCDPNLDNSLASNWEASEDEYTTLQSTTIKATPGSGCVLHTAVTPKLQSGITVYPNPTSDNLYISNSANDQLEITVLSSLGKSVKSLQANQGVTSVDLSDLPKGIYMVKMLNKTSRKTQMQKVVVR